MNLPLFGELEKLTHPLPSRPASLNSEKRGLKVVKPVQNGLPEQSAKIALSDDARETLTELVPSWENSKMAEGVGFEPTVGLPLRLISSQVPLTTQPPFRTIICTDGHSMPDSHESSAKYFARLRVRGKLIRRRSRISP